MAENLDVEFGDPSWIDVWDIVLKNW